jgi:3',5'-cyclic AMP phosphodiesterase CpdA
MRLAWATDVHLNFLPPPARREFAAEMRAQEPEVVLLAGDIAEAHDLAPILESFAAEVAVPVYYVLGNHDFYGGRIESVRARTRILEESAPTLRWLPSHDVVALTARTALIGHDGWGDTRLGDFDRTPVMLNDFVHIEDLVTDRRTLRATLMRLGDEAAAHFARVLPEALERFEHVVAVTHVPPFREACWHAGEISNDDWLPFFSCKAVGDVLVHAMRAHPTRRMTVLCGHTHSSGVARILPNLTVHTGGARYGAPTPQGTIVVE